MDVANMDKIPKFSKFADKIIDCYITKINQRFKKEELGEYRCPENGWRIQPCTYGSLAILFNCYSENRYFDLTQFAMYPIVWKERAYYDNVEWMMGLLELTLYKYHTQVEKLLFEKNPTVFDNYIDLNIINTNKITQDAIEKNKNYDFKPQYFTDYSISKPQIIETLSKMLSEKRG